MNIEDEIMKCVWCKKNLVPIGNRRRNGRKKSNGEYLVDHDERRHHISCYKKACKDVGVMHHYRNMYVNI